MTAARLSNSILTERLVLRRWRETDRAPFAAMNADARVMEFFPRPLDRNTSDDVIDKFEAHCQEHGFAFWALEERATGEFAGFTGLMRFDFNAPFSPGVEIGWRLPAAFWGRGLASEAALASLAFGFEMLNLPEIVAFTPVSNARSRRVMEGIGMARDLGGGDFIHPKMPADHRLQPCVLYRIRQAAAARQDPAAGHHHQTEPRS